MPNLFIIGNGFDIEHGLPTEYKCFRQFLIDEYDADENVALSEPSITIGHHGDEYPNASEVASLVSRMLVDASIDSEWNNFEESLGNFEYDEFFDLCTIQDREGDVDLWHTSNNMEDVSSSLLRAIPHLKVLFTEWIDTIKISSLRKPRFVSIMDPNRDLFLNFNYTLTLEKIYGCKNVCHIHGKQGSQILVGHGDDTKDTRDSDNTYYPEAISNLADIKQALRKDTTKALEQNRTFFDSVANIDNVYSIGFSYNDVDLVYIKEICRQLDAKPYVWTFHDYAGDRPKFMHFKTVITNFDFKGIFKEELLI